MTEDDGDDVGMTGTTWGRCEDNRDNMWRPQTMETTWGPSGSYGDDVRTTGTMWGQCGDDGDDVGMTGTM